MASNQNSSGGTSIAGLLGIAFVVLKLCHVINWSWWWVTAPFWGWIAVAIVLLFGAFVLASIATIIELLFSTPSQRRKRKRAKAAREALDSYARALNRRRY